MLPRSHSRAYQDLLALLTEFASLLITNEPINSQDYSRQKFRDLSEWFELQITTLSQDDLSMEIAPRWQAVQTEIKREFKLLSTDMLFLSSARQNDTQRKRLQSITNRLTKLIGYCQIILKDSD
jgi:hypothetical protein